MRMRMRGVQPLESHTDENERGATTGKKMLMRMKGVQPQESHTDEDENKRGATIGKSY